MKRIIPIIVAFLFTLAAGTGLVQGADREKSIHVAVSVYSKGPAFMRKWISDLKQHPAVLDGRVKLDIFDCAGRHDIQYSHFESITARKHDAVIVVANDMFASKKLAELLVESKIPVVASCAQTSANEQLEAFIGPDDFQAGYLTAVAVAEKLNGQGNVVVLRGPSGQGSTQFRNAGIRQALADYPGIKEIRSEAGDWSGAKAMQSIQQLLGRNLKIDGIIAQNDEMALGALHELSLNGMASVPTASIDGMGEAVDAVQNGELLQTLRQDSALQAQGALGLVLRKVIGPEYTPECAAWEKDLLEQWEEGTLNRFIIPWGVIAASKME